MRICDLCGKPAVPVFGSVKRHGWVLVRSRLDCQWERERGAGKLTAPRPQDICGECVGELVQEVKAVGRAVKELPRSSECGGGEEVSLDEAEALISTMTGEQRIRFSERLELIANLSRTRAAEASLEPAPEPQPAEVAP